MIMLINPGKTLAPWVLAIEQESYLSYLRKVIKKLLQIRDSSHSYSDDFNNIYNNSISKH